MVLLLLSLVSELCLETMAGGITSNLNKGPEESLLSCMFALSHLDLPALELFGDVLCICVCVQDCSCAFNMLNILVLSPLELYELDCMLAFLEDSPVLGIPTGSFCYCNAFQSVCIPEAAVCWLACVLFT